MVSCWGKLINEGSWRNVVNIARNTVSNFHNFPLAWCCCVSVLLILRLLHLFSIKWLLSFLLSFYNYIYIGFFFLGILPTPELVLKSLIRWCNSWNCTGWMNITYSIMEPLILFWFYTAGCDPLLCCRTANGFARCNFPALTKETTIAF